MRGILASGKFVKPDEEHSFWLAQKLSRAQRKLLHTSYMPTNLAEPNFPSLVCLCIFVREHSSSSNFAAVRDLVQNNNNRLQNDPNSQGEQKHRFQNLFHF